MAHQPTSDEVIIVSVQDPLSPFLVFESLEEIVAGKDFGTICSSASGHAGGTTVDVVCGRDLEISAFDVGGTKPIPCSCGPSPITFTFDPLAGSYSTNLVILERSQDPRHQAGWPCNIIIGHDSDGSADFGEGFANLKSFVGDWGVENLNFGEIQRVCQTLQSLSLVVGGDQDQLSRLASQDTLQ